jgi:hypothetical protein
MTLLDVAVIACLALLLALTIAADRRITKLSRLEPTLREMIESKQIRYIGERNGMAIYERIDHPQPGGLPES